MATTPQRGRSLIWLAVLLVAALFCCGGFFIWLAAGAPVDRLPAAVQTAIAPVFNPLATRTGSGDGTPVPGGVPQPTSIPPGGDSDATPQACPVGFVFDPLLGICVEVTVLPPGGGTPHDCPVGFVFDPILGICIQLTVLPGDDGNSRNCPIGLVFDPILGICIEVTALPPGGGTPHECPIGFVFDPLLDICVQLTVFP
jgi:hypothetical protein